MSTLAESLLLYYCILFTLLLNYILLCITNINKFLHSFQYKLFNHILHFRKKSRMKNTSLYTVCNKEEGETPLYIFSELATFFENNLILPPLLINIA